MKVGTDGVLLGAWVGVHPTDRRMLDIGTGTGLIALMLAQRTAAFMPSQVTHTTPPTADGASAASDPLTVSCRQSGSDPLTASERQVASPCRTASVPSALSGLGRGNTTDSDTSQKGPYTGPEPIPVPKSCGCYEGVRITGIDIDDVSQARENADASPWGTRIAFVQCAVQTFCPEERFDLVVSNPPFFVDSLTSPDAGRTQARHAVTLPFEALCEAVVRLLAPGGRFAVILPVDEALRFQKICSGRLSPVRRTEVRTTPRRPAKRVLMEFIHANPSIDALLSESAVVSGDAAARSASAPSPSASGDQSSTVLPAFVESSIPSAPCTASVPRYPSPHAVPETAPGGFAAPVPSAPCNPVSPSVPAAAAASDASSECDASAAAMDSVPAASPAAPLAPAVVSECLVIGTGEHERYTPEYRALTRDFYLKF